MNYMYEQNLEAEPFLVQSELERLANGGCCETPPPSLPRGSATPPKFGPANSEADSGQPTSTRTDHPTLDLHELMSRRVEHLAVIQAEMSESARLVEVGNKLCRQTELCRSFLEAGQMPFGGQQQLDKIVQRSEQLATDLNAQQLRSIAAGRVMAAHLTTG